MSQEDKTIELLAIIYNAVDWGKMRTNKNPYDIFNHRIRAASRRATLFEAVSKLANYFGLQSLPAVSKLANYFGLQSLPEEAIRIANELREYERETLNRLYTEHVPMSMLAIMRAKEIREERKKNKNQIFIFEEELKNE